MKSISPHSKRRVDAPGGPRCGAGAIPFSVVDDWVSRRLGRWIGGWFRQAYGHVSPSGRRADGQRGKSLHSEAGFRFTPRITPLEPRIVLNATAELSAITGLSVLGDFDNDTVRINVVDSGTAIQLTDGGGAIIPIMGHTGGATGNETDPLAVSDITGGQVSIDLGGGDDLLEIELPDGIHLDVIDGAGDDRTEIDVQPNVSPSPATTIRIESETIDLAPSGSLVQFADRDVELIGDVSVGGTGSTQIEIGEGAFRVEGRFDLGGDVRFVGGGGDVDLGDAVASATTASVGLFVQLDPDADSSVRFGPIDGSAGSLIDELRVVSSTDSVFDDVVSVEGTLTVNSRDQVLVDGDLLAGNIDVDAEEVTVAGAIDVDRGPIVLSASSELRVTGDLDSTAVGAAGNITLGGSNVYLDGMAVSTAGANVIVSGQTRILGDVQIDTGLAGSVFAGGDVTWFGTIASDPSSTAGSLAINTAGVAKLGTVNLTGNVGGMVAGDPNDLRSLSIAGGSLSVRDLGIDGGSISLDGDVINVFAANLRASDQAAFGGGGIHLAGDTVFQLMDTDVIAAGQFLMDGMHQTLGPNDSVTVTTGGLATIRGQFTGGDRLTIDSTDSVRVEADLLGWTSIDLAGDNGIQVAMQQIEAVDLIAVENVIQFESDASLSSSEVRFDQDIVVAASRVVELDAVMIDASVASVIEKQGAGELVLLGDNTLSTDLVVRAGTLRVDGSLVSTTQVDVLTGAVLSGSGEVAGPVVSIGGTIAPNEFTPGGPTGQLGLGSLVFDMDSRFHVDIDGAVAGASLDSLRISGQPIDLAGALLELDISVTLPGDTELIVLANDSAGQVGGRFFVDFDEDGNPLSAPRELFEGARVLNEFGNGAAAVPAFITYFGGDGNDVAIVTAGDRIETVGNVTLITRVGVDLHIQTGDSLSDAENAVPTIRPIAGLNGGTLTIDPVALQAELYVDIDGFVDLGSVPLHFNADILFDTASVGGAARVHLFDSDLSTVDSPTRFDASYLTAQQLQLSFNHDAAVAPQYSVLMGGVAQVDLQLPSSVLAVSLSDSDDQVIALAGAGPTVSVYQITTGVESHQFAFQHPADRLIVDGRGGDDVLRFDSFGADLDAVPTVAGGLGNDQLIWNAGVDVGRVGANEDLQLEAESVTIVGGIRLTGGGAIAVVAVDQFTVSSEIDSTMGQILFESSAAISDLSTGRLVSAAVDVGVSLHGGDYLLGEITTAAGTVALGTIDGLGSIGTVQQAAGTGVVAVDLTAVSSELIELESTINEFETANLTANDSVTLLDSSGDLLLTISAPNAVSARTAGELVIDSVTTSDSVVLTAGTNLVAFAAQPLLHVDGSAVELIAGVPLIGQSNPPGTVAAIGSAANPLRVNALQVFSATSSGTNGSVFVTSPALSGIPSAAGALPIGLVDAGSGRIVIQAVTIDDASPSGDVDLLANEIDLLAVDGIGADATLKATGVAQLWANSGFGSIRLDLDADQTINLEQVTTGGGVGEEIRIQHVGEHRLSVSEISNDSGDVIVSAAVASIDVLQRSGGVTLSAGGAGDVHLENLGGQSDITVRGGIASQTGDVTIHAQRNLVFTSSGRLESVDGDVSLVGGLDSTLTASTIALSDGSEIDVGSGTASLIAPGNVFVSSIRSTNSGDAISITAQTGALIDAGDQQLDLVAEQGTTRIDVAAGIGEGNAIETEINRLSAWVRQQGTLEIDEGSAIELLDVATSDGKIEIVAAGSITVQQLRSMNVSESDGSDHRDVTLTTTGTGSDILIGALTGDNVTDVHLISGDDVLQLGSGSLTIADDLRIVSQNATADGTDAVRLRTDVNDLEATVLGSARGDLAIDELNTIELASSDRNDDNEIVATSNGTIHVNAGESISIADSLIIDDQSTLRGDVEIIAGGQQGRILFQAGDSIELGDLVQIKADQSTAAAIVIESPEVVLGNDFQIETGDSVGVARRFAPRPMPELNETAFYDSTTIHTNRLEQAAINDATGILTLDIGVAGERGLTINIDWGAETARFQQIDLLSGDAPLLSVEHLYLEQDILDARFNGRTSSTDPLEVRFSVRHHESIVVMGKTIQQAGSDVEVVEGELISSTDNPLTEDDPVTPILENGEARFIIPALSIPVAFFPVRDVIPTIEQEPVIVSNEQTFVVLGIGFETTETVASSTTAREEYFQLRVLSPDPEGEDLVPPTRLPDDIISGDQLQTLFESLPDGRYDLQYVLGDGNVRSILSVDLRDGKPILPGGQLEGGVLRLTPVDPDSESWEPEQQEAAEGEAPPEQLPGDPSADDSDQASRASQSIRIDQAKLGRLSVAARLSTRAMQSPGINSDAGENQ